MTEEHVLSNGLRVRADYRPITPMVCVDIIYRAGGKYATGRQSGMAHLLEHLMFGGSANAPEYDKVLDAASGRNNASTGDDYVNYWAYLPVANIETALFLESDRLRAPLLDAAHLEVQRSVVIEEFKQTHINQPYGMLAHDLRNALYGPGHPYGIPVIGKDIEGLAALELEDVRDFFYKHYRPDNAVLVISGGIEPDKAFALAEKWFGDIDRPGIVNANSIVTMPEVTTQIIERHEAGAPRVVTVTAWPMSASGTDEYFAADLLTDLLSEGPSSRMYRNLLMATDVFTGVEASISGLEDEGYLMLTCQLANPDATPEDVNKALDMARNEMMQLADARNITPEELRRNTMRREAKRTFDSIQLTTRASQLAQGAMRGIDPDRLSSIYAAITPGEMAKATRDILSRPSVTVTTFPGSR